MTVRDCALRDRAAKEGTVPLSEHEQRLLDEIEQALYAEDPKFAASVRSARTPSKTRRLAILCILGVVVGLGLVFVGLFTTVIPLSVVGFVLVVAAAGYAATSLRHRGHSRGNTSQPSNVRQLRSGGLRSRMEDRLRRRFDES
jgi:hypothetical protein